MKYIVHINVEGYHSRAELEEMRKIAMDRFKDSPEYIVLITNNVQIKVYPQILYTLKKAWFDFIKFIFAKDGNKEILPKEEK